MDRDLNSIYKYKINRRLRLDFFLVIFFAVVVYFIASSNDLLEKLITYSSKHESWELDEFITVFIYLVFALMFFSIRRWYEINELKNELVSQNTSLKKAVAEIKRLRGILPICANCKRIRDDAGYWHQVELYVRDHTDAEFTHSICPDCIKMLYSDLDDELPEGEE